MSGGKEAGGSQTPHYKSGEWWFHQTRSVETPTGRPACPPGRGKGARVAGRRKILFRKYFMQQPLFLSS